MSASGRCLVLGYGSPVRRDDGLGPAVATAVEALGLAGVDVHIVHQLTPELAETLAGYERAIFIDATAAARIDVAPLSPREQLSGVGHHGDPRTLLALARTLYGRCPAAWYVTVPGSDFGLGEGLSDAAVRRVPEAVQFVRTLATS